MITDKKIRALLKDTYKVTKYKGKALPHLRLVDELAIPKRICLADVVAIPVSQNASDGLHGFEIKSEVDSLTRLESQVHYYSKVFKRCTLVVTEKHEEKAIAMIPDWWGVILALPTGFDAYSEPLDDIILLEIREAKENPTPLSPYSLTQLLWRTELMELVKSKEVEVKKSGSKRVLRTAITKQIPIDELESTVISYLAERVEWKIPGVKYEPPKRKRSTASKPRGVRRIRKKKIN